MVARRPPISSSLPSWPLSLIRDSPAKCAAIQCCPYRRGAALAVNRALAAVKQAWHEWLRQDRNVIPALQLAVPVPQFHRMVIVPLLGEHQRRTVIVRLELAEMIDVAAEAVHEIETIVQ